ncbi:conserved protein of unknown function [uncultured Sphingopyxis sp.]|uniref:Uncharacterized protein n=1 Tax=uncultured Sphingopyxis sp. TaxID=310581 RepID=A0A1Y5PPG8_9SPHN|nr:hypothetical protein [uncultured Sphingopyxis sp.]SBV31871.1 conserved protein of unknown function [uncultured Sphingopyxis sp.]
MNTPDNITRLHSGEEKLRVESLRRIAEIPDLATHLLMVEQTMNLIHALLPSTEVTDEYQLELGNLGIRCFNALASCLKLALSGYYQAAAIHIRDLLEMAFLLDYFSMDPALVTQWRTMSDRDRKKAFKPVAIREALDKRDGFTKQKRKAAYEQLSKLAGHATPEGAVMLAPDPNVSTVHCGPFLETTALRAVLSEAALTSIQAAGAFRTLIKRDGLEVSEARVGFLHAEAAWAKCVFGKELGHLPLAELRFLLDLVRKQEAET